MDPFSITVGVVGLIGTSSKIITSLKDVADSAKGIDGRLRVLISDVENFKAMLESTRATLDSSEIQRVFQATGYLASHWTNISACISDGEVLLANFASKLAKIDKSVSFLDSARKALRLKSSWEDVVAFQSQLSSCRETISVSLQVVVLCTQVLPRGTGGGHEFHSEVMELVTTIHQTSQDVCSRMEALGQGLPAEMTEKIAASLKNMKKCIRSSARIATTASSLSSTADDTNSIAEASDFHDFLCQPNPDTIAWIKSTSKLDLVAIDHAPSLHSLPVTLLSAHDLSDSDDDFEREIAPLHLKRGRQAFDGGDLSTAESLLRKGLDRLKDSKSQRQHVEIYKGGLNDLAALYRQQGKWRETKELINERLSLLSRTATADSTEVLEEKLTLAEVLLQLNDLVEARLHAKTCIKAYHKLGLEGKKSLERSLKMMITICTRQHDADGEEEYQLVLSNLLVSKDASMMLNPPQDEMEVTDASGMSSMPKVEITKPASLDMPNECDAAETTSRKDSLSSCLSEPETSANGHTSQPDVHGELEILRRTLEVILSHLLDFKDRSANQLLRHEPYGLEGALYSLSAECEKLGALIYATDGSHFWSQIAIWMVVHDVVDRCLGEAADPLKKYLQSLNHHEPWPVKDHQFHHLLKGFEVMIPKLEDHTQLLRMLRSALELGKSILETNRAREETRVQNSDDNRETLYKAEFEAYKAADLLKGYTDQLRWRGSQDDPSVDIVIKTTEEIRKYWRSTSRNVHFPERAPGNNHFIGQKEQLEEIRKAFEETDSPVPGQKRFVLHGLPGSGKSEVALKYATEHRGQFWGVFWVNASSKTNATDSYIEMAKVFGESLTEEAAMQYLSKRPQVHPWLLIIDNADDENLKLGSLVPSGGNGCVLVTTRDPRKIKFGTAGQKHLRLSSMHKDDAIDLLLAAAEYKKESKDQEIPQQHLREAENICQQLHYLPLALIHAGKAMCHNAIRMAEYMTHLKLEANIVRERWKTRGQHQDLNPQSGSLDVMAFDETSRISVFASFELLTFSRLNKHCNEPFIDAIRLLQIFSFLDPQNIRVDFLIEAALNPIRETIERNESQLRESEVLDRLGLKAHVSWAQVVQRAIQAKFSLFSFPPLLPEALKNPQNLDVDDLQDQVEFRVRSALHILASRSLIIRATRDDKMLKNDEMANDGDGNEDGEKSVDSYYMHPLVHQWVRERPSFSVAQQALYCQYALTILSNSVRLSGGNTDQDMAFRRAIKPHIEKALEFSEAIEKRIGRNLARDDWWYKRWARQATQLSSGPSQTQMQMGQNARFGKVFLECGAYDKGQDLLSMVHDYLIQSLGPDHQLAHLARLGLAKVLLLQSRPKASTDLLRQVYSSRRKTFGEKHPQTLEVTMELAESLLFLGRISESSSLSEQALASLKQAYGHNHRKAIHCVNLIGCVQYFYSDFDACLAQHREVMRLVGENAGDGDGAVSVQEILVYKGHLAGALLAMSQHKPESEREGFLAEAEQLIENVVTKRQGLLGRWHPVTLFARAQWGRIAAARSRQDPKRLAKIAEMMSETLKVAEEDLGDSHLGVLAGQKWYAEVLILQGRLDEAEVHLREACDKEKYAEASDIGGEHPDRIYAVWELVQLLERKGSLEEALRLCRELEANIKTVSGHGLGASHRFNGRLLRRIEELEGRLGR